ncbi:restriction endonuclease [Streptomyces sp. NPDC056500]|uniref:restriction endonuclease n=1 Tax=Streptomyces sp. NPDC056500 TaxID=3345840 RepID=UPI0036921DF6
MTTPSSDTALPAPARLSWTVHAYQELNRATPGQEAARGQKFNAFLANLLRLGGLHDAVSDQRGLNGRDEIDVFFTLGYTPYIVEAKWTTKPTDADALLKIEGRLKTRPSGTRAVLISMSGYTRHALDLAQSHADVLLLDRAHVEAMTAGLITAEALFHAVLSLASRRGGSYVPLTDLLDPPTPRDPLPTLRPASRGVEHFPALPEPDVTVTGVLTSDGPWTAGEVNGVAAAADGSLLWTVMDGVLSTDSSGVTGWTAAPALCRGPALAADGSTFVLSAEAALRLGQSQAHVVGGGFTGAHWLMPGPDKSAWVFSTTGPQTTRGYGGHILTRLGDTLADSTAHGVPFDGQVHQAALTPTGTLYLASGGHSVTTNADQGLACPTTNWVRSAPLTPTAALAIGDHTVLLAGPTGTGIEKALYAVDTRNHQAVPLLRLPNTTRITGLAGAGQDAVHLLTDIRGNDQTPRPFLLHVTIPAPARP